VEHQIMHSQKSVEISVFSGISGKAFGFRQQLEASSQQLFFKDRTRFRLGGRGFAPWRDTGFNLAGAKSNDHTAFCSPCQ